MIVLEFLLARRLANLYWSGFGHRSGHYLLKWSGLRALAEGKILDEHAMQDVVKYLLSMGFLLAQNDDGVIVWHKTEINPRDITERALHCVLGNIPKENEVDIENEVAGLIAQNRRCCSDD